MNVITTSENHCLLACDDLQSDTQHIFEEHEASVLKAEEILQDASITLKKVVKIYQTAWCLNP